MIALAIVAYTVLLIMVLAFSPAIAIVAYIMLLALVVMFNHAASVLSEHED
jgi:hypothetical protein